LRIRRRSLRKLLIAAGCLVAVFHPPGLLFGGLLIGVGLGLHLWSKGCLEQNRRLTTSGPYRFSRNPFYFANLLIDLGLCFVIGRWWVAAVYLPIWWMSYRDTIALEEARLGVLFPDTFPQYMEAVPKLIPTGRRLRGAAGGGRFSFQNESLAKGSEYARLFGVVLAPATIWVCTRLRRDGMALFEDQNALALGSVAFLMAAWVVKLALAETFRRPHIRLLPFSTRPWIRGGVAALLVSLGLAHGGLWSFSPAVLWCLLLALDRAGESRADQALAADPDLHCWRYFPPIAWGAAAIFGCFAYLVRLPVG
jgi:hypothetical protein